MRLTHKTHASPSIIPPSLSEPPRALVHFPARRERSALSRRREARTTCVFGLPNSGSGGGLGLEGGFRVVEAMKAISRVDFGVRYTPIDEISGGRRGFWQHPRFRILFYEWTSNTPNPAIPARPVSKVWFYTIVQALAPYENCGARTQQPVLTSRLSLHRIPSSASCL